MKWGKAKGFSVVNVNVFWYLFVSGLFIRVSFLLFTGTTGGIKLVGLKILLRWKNRKRLLIQSWGCTVGHYDPFEFFLGHIGGSI